jgi:GGDEF domain-containing protein
MQKPTSKGPTIQRLDSRPLLSDLQKIVAQSLAKRGGKIVIAWSDQTSGSEYTLSVETNNMGDDPEWRMHMFNESAAKILWMYVSEDPLLVYNLVTTSLPEDERHPRKADGSPVEGIAREQETTAKHSTNTNGQTSGSHHLPITKSEKGETPKKAVLSGDLSLVQVTNLLPSMQMARMTGKLTFESAHCRTHVYFEDGAPVHAYSEEEEGQEALLEVLTWKEGHFNFQPKEAAPKKTVDQALDTLMLKGVKIIDCANYLAAAGIDADTLLDKKQSSLAKEQFDEMVSNSKIDTTSLKKLYERFNATTTLAEAARSLGLPRSKWAGLVAQLLRLDLIKKCEPKMASRTLMPKIIDTEAVEAIKNSMLSGSTGLYTYEAFLFFLEQEYLRRFRTESDLSVIIFEMKTVRQGSVTVREPLNAENVNAFGKRLNLIKRPLDLVAHYENHDFAILLPNTGSQGAFVFASRVVESFKKDPLETANGSDIALTMGIAGMPTDFLDPPFLLAGAEAAKEEALRSNLNIVQFKDLPDPYGM